MLLFIIMPIHINCSTLINLKIILYLVRIWMIFRNFAAN